MSVRIRVKNQKSYIICRGSVRCHVIIKYSVSVSVTSETRTSTTPITVLEGKIRWTALSGCLD